MKAYDGVNGLWTHIVLKHDDVDDELRLEEIGRTALEWRKYWDNLKDGGKHSNVTRMRLDQVEQEGLDWQTVLGWQLGKKPSHYSERDVCDENLGEDE